MPPTRSINLWNILIEKYITVHHKDKKYITRLQAHADLTELYHEFHHCQNTGSADSYILSKIYKIIVEYEKEVKNSIRRQKANLSL